MFKGDGVQPEASVSSPTRNALRYVIEVFKNTHGPIARGVASALAVLLLFGVVWIGLKIGGGGSSDEFAGSAIIARGEALYHAECAECHGTTGERIPIVPLNSKAFLDGRGDATLLTIISEGKGVMPAFGSLRGGPFKGEDTLAVLAFLNHNVGRDSTSILANAGQEVFESTCSKCHGSNGDRIPIAPLNASGFLNSKTNVELLEAISKGKGAMPPQGKGEGGTLEEVDINAIVAYLRYGVEERTSQLASRGRELYLGNCLQCHGTEGNRIQAIDLTSPGFLESLGDGTIINSITQGKGLMPGFGVSQDSGSMGVPDIAALLAYIKTWAGVNSTSALVGPAQGGQGGQGGTLFLQNCAGCHGAAGDGVVGIRLLSSEFLNRETDAVLLRTITQGNAKGMPAWGKEVGGPFSQAQIQSILAYLKASAVSDKPDSPVVDADPTDTEPAGGFSVSITKETVANGKEIFMGTCVMCHGEARDKVLTCPLPDPSFLQERGDETLIQSITFGKGPMPAWGAEKGGPLSTADVESVVAFLKNAAGIGEIQDSPSGDVPAAGDDITPSDDPALSAVAIANGKEIFMGTCVMCHGETRDKVLTCPLPDPSFLQERGDETLIQSITFGKGPMPAWGAEKGGPLSTEDVKSVLAFLKDAAGLGKKPDSPPTDDPAQSEGPALSEAVIARGEEKFMSTCTMCHGETRDKIPTCELANGDWLKEKEFAGVVKAISEGKPPMMPAWAESNGGSLSDDDIYAIASFLWDAAGVDDTGGEAPGEPQTTAEAPATPEATPASFASPSIEEGRTIFMGTCIMCHGEQGLNITQCPIGSKQWISNMSLEGLMARISRGKKSAGMPSWGEAFGGPYNGDQIFSITMYLGDVAQ